MVTFLDCQIANLTGLMHCSMNYYGIIVSTDKQKLLFIVRYTY
jgi:hypothetical protein